MCMVLAKRHSLNPELGTYDSCFFIGKYAKLLCPGPNLGPTRVRREYPNYSYPGPLSRTIEGAKNDRLGFDVD
jgi:hypothetical protein